MAKYITYSQKIHYTGKQNQKKIIESTIKRLDGKLSPSELWGVKNLRHQHRQLAMEKKEYNKLKAGMTRAERKEMRAYFERYEKRLDKKFKKLYGLKWDRKTRTYKQERTSAGRKLATFNRFGMTDVETKRPIEYAPQLGYNPANDFIRTKEEFIETYGGTNRGDLKRMALEYNVIGNFRAFYDLTSSVGWVIRFRDYVGVSPEVDADEFVKWCLEAGIGGMR